MKATIALDLIREFVEFPHYRGCEDLSSAVTKESDILVDWKLETQKQSSILNFVRIKCYEAMLAIKCYEVTE